MATYADTYETPKQEGGLLSRMFNALTPKFLKDYISEIKQELKAIDRETEWQRQGQIEFYALSEIKHGSNDTDTVEAYTDFLKNNKEAHRYGEINAAEILLMKQKIKAGEHVPQVSIIDNENATLEA